jgi:hypothetical protein
MFSGASFVPCPILEQSISELISKQSAEEPDKRTTDNAPNPTVAPSPQSTKILEKNLTSAIPECK